MGREIFTSRPFFIRGRNRGGHTRPGISLPARFLFEGAIGADIHAPVASVAAIDALGEEDAVPFGVLK